VLFVGFELARSIWQSDKPAVKISQRFVIIRTLGLFSVLLFLIGMLVMGWWSAVKIAGNGIQSATQWACVMPGASSWN